MGRKVTAPARATISVRSDPGGRSEWFSPNGEDARSGPVPSGALVSLLLAELALFGLLSASGNIPLLVLKAFRALLTL